MPESARTCVSTGGPPGPAGRYTPARAQRGLAAGSVAAGSAAAGAARVSAATVGGSRRHDDLIMELAARQHGVVSRMQLLHAGVSPQLLARRLKAERLRALHRGVYLVGPLTTAATDAIAAVLACGTSAVLSHRSAAALLGLLPLRRRSPAVDVIVFNGDRRRPHIRIHRIPSLRSDEVTRVEQIPVTTAARTLLDLAGTASARELERALAEALHQRRASRGELSRIMEYHPRQHGIARLAALLGLAQPAYTRSEAEEKLLALIRKAQLPEPEVNVEVCGYEVDFFWRSERLIAEVDGFAFHSSATRFDMDRRRDAVLAASGLRVMRVTWRQLESEPEALLVRLAQALARAAPGQV